MAKFYSATLGGFLDDTVHAHLPEDAVAITDAMHATLLVAQRAGKVIVAKANGEPHAVEPATPDLGTRRTSLVVRIKREAARRIDLVAPAWRQINDVRELPYSQGEQRAAIEGRFAVIDAIRVASDHLEAKIALLGARALAQIDVAAPSHWPS